VGIEIDTMSFRSHERAHVIENLSQDKMVPLVRYIICLPQLPLLHQVTGSCLKQCDVKRDTYLQPLSRLTRSRRWIHPQTPSRVCCVSCHKSTASAKRAFVTGMFRHGSTHSRQSLHGIIATILSPGLVVVQGDSTHARVGIAC
jgi:hypothetical protein